MQWYNEPPFWEHHPNGQITVTAGAMTDFWRVTRHDYIVDNGNFYYAAMTGDFTVQVKITGEYKDLYDQAGIMARLDEMTWLKCGIEYVEGIHNASAVITREFSDWSVIPLLHRPTSVWFRVTRFGADVEVYYSLDGTVFTMIREAYFTDAPTLQVGLMVAAPRGSGFQTIFDEFSLRSRT